MATIELGLIGTNIGKSRSPRLHELAGELCGLDIRYRGVDLADGEETFEEAFARCRRAGMRGVNITHPFKSRVLSLVDVPDPSVRRIASVNTVRFPDPGASAEQRPQGFNTDFSGFIRAYRRKFGTGSPGRVALIGAGGVGKALAFALVELGASEVRVVDNDLQVAEQLARNLSPVASGQVSTGQDAADAVRDADGVINATPLGMWSYPGSPLPAAAFGPQRWAFDAVYTPSDTEFLKAAEAAGLRVLSGYDLFFHQGVDAFEIFCGVVPDEHRLFQAITEPV